MNNVNVLLFFSLLSQVINLVSAKRSQKQDVKHHHHVYKRRMMGKMLFPAIKRQPFHNTDCSITKLILGVTD